jgi:hypothetical protein
MKIKVDESYNIMFTREPFQVKITKIYKLGDIFYVKYLDSFNKTESVETAEYFKSCVERANSYKDSDCFEEIEI